MIDPFFRDRIKAELAALYAAYGPRPEKVNGETIPWTPFQFAVDTLRYLNTNVKFFSGTREDPLGRTHQRISSESAQKIKALYGKARDLIIDYVIADTVAVPLHSATALAPAEVASKAASFFNATTAGGRPDPIVLRASATAAFWKTLWLLAAGLDYAEGEWWERLKKERLPGPSDLPSFFWSALPWWAKAGVIVVGGAWLFDKIKVSQ